MHALSRKALAAAAAAGLRLTAAAALAAPKVVVISPPAFPNRPSRGPRTGKLLRPQPNASCAVCPDHAQPR
jgi:hypothetical protein